MVNANQLKIQVRERINQMIEKEGVYYTVGFLESILVSTIRADMTDDAVRDLVVVFGLDKAQYIEDEQ